MDSSPDLSLKLRRGSSDSRDSFYMDFAQGIDSDIEEVDTTKNSTTGPQQLSQHTSQPHVSPPPPPPPLPPFPPLYQAPTQMHQPHALSPLPQSPPDSPLSTMATGRTMIGGVHHYQHSPPQYATVHPKPKQQFHDYQSLEILESPAGFRDESAGMIGSSLLPSPPLPPAHADNVSSTVLVVATADVGGSGYHSRAASIGTVMTNSMDNTNTQSCTNDDDDSVCPGNADETSESAGSLPLPPTPLSIEERTVMELPPAASYLHHSSSDQHPLPSPISSGNILVSSETISHNSSPAKSSSRMHSSHRVTIDESKFPLSTSSTHHQLVTIATGPPSTSSSTHQHLGMISASGGGGSGGGVGGGGHHLALMYHHTHSHHHMQYPVLPIARRSSRMPDPRYPAPREIRASEALATTFSALYGKLLVVMGIAFPMAEVISTYIPPSFYEGFYLYLYIGSMMFLFFMYATLLWGRPKLMSSMESTPKRHSKRSSTTSASDSMDESDTESVSCSRIPNTMPAIRRPSVLAPLGRQHHYGSFYLRMGAVAFGIGSMIYSGLEFGQYFELERDTKCHNVMLALTPATRMAFIFIQMYFIFLNNEQIKVYRHKILARFGLMHMIGTNLSVWLNVLIQETKHEILTFYNPENRTLRISHRLGNRIQNLQEHSAHLRVARGLKGPYQIFECRRTNIIGTLVQDASPFLFPCTIEYSLICAAILYVMWRSISRPQTQPPIRIEGPHSPCKRSPHHYSVDCARAHKGLFIGILILVLTIISLILFFVLISRPEFVSLAVTEVTICELTIYVAATMATLIGMIQVRHLQYDAARSFELDDILLVGAQTGSFLYSTFTVIGGHFTLRRDTILVLITALASIVQTACQTMFILDASRRQAVSPEHIRKKPGREIVTFMLVANLAMWAISTLEKSRAESHPIQLNFYGLWAWTIITHVSMPLAIFYRFHSTVCLCEIWKRAYKLKPTYM